MEKLTQNSQLTEKRTKIFQQLDYAIGLAHEKQIKPTPEKPAV